MKKWIDLGAHVVLGLVFTVFGLNGLLMAFGGSGFIPMPELPERAGALMGGLAATGYFLPVLKIVEVVGGLLLLAQIRAGLAQGGGVLATGRLPHRAREPGRRRDPR